MKNKQNMLIFGAYAAILYFCFGYGFGGGFAGVVYLLASASMVISIGYFVMILYKKCMSLYDKLYLGINEKGEE